MRYEKQDSRKRVSGSFIERVAEGAEQDKKQSESTSRTRVWISHAGNGKLHYSYHWHSERKSKDWTIESHV